MHHSLLSDYRRSNFNNFTIILDSQAQGSFSEAFVSIKLPTHDLTADKFDRGFPKFKEEAIRDTRPGSDQVRYGCGNVGGFLASQPSLTVVVAR